MRSADFLRGCVWAAIVFLFMCICVVEVEAVPFLDIASQNRHLNIPFGSRASIPYTITNATSRTLTGLTIHPPPLTQILQTNCNGTLAPSAVCVVNVSVQSPNGERSGHLLVDPLKVCAFNGAVCAFSNRVNNQVSLSLGATRFAYLTRSSPNEMRRVDTQNNTLLNDVINLSGLPGRAFMAPNGLNVYTLRAPSFALRAVSISANVESVLAFGFSPSTQVLVSPDSRLIYILGISDNTLHVFSASTLQEVRTLSITVAQPRSMALTPDGRRIYITSATGNIIRVLDLVSEQVTSISLTTGNGNGIVLTPDGSRAYVALSDIDRVAVINTATDTEILPRIVVGDFPQAIVVSLDAQRVYVINATSGTVSVIRTADNVVIDTITGVTVFSQMAITPDGRRLYVARGNETDVFNLVNDNDLLIARLTAFGPLGIAIAP